MSLRARLTLFYTLFLALVLIAVATAVYAFTERSLIAALEERVEQTLDGILVDQEYVRDGRTETSKVYLIGEQTLPDDAYFLTRITFLRNLSKWEDLMGGQTYNTSLFTRQRVHTNPTADNLFDTISDDTYRELFQTGTAVTRLRVPDREAGLVVFLRQHPFFTGAANYQALSLVAMPLPIATLNGLRNLLVRTTFFAFVSFALGVWLLSYRVLMPVKRVTQAAAQVTGRDLSQRVPVPKTNDELTELAVTLNNMLDRLQESFETQRRFTADASHELRTPVTAIVGHANYILRRTKPSPEQIDSLTVIRREADRMAKLVNDLLELARADAGFSIQREPMNLVEVIEAVHMDVAPVAGKTDITVTSSQPLIEVLGDASRLKQVVLNLVQNAINAGSSQVRVSAFKEKKEVRLEVFDDGPGIPEDALPHLFDRFYRVDGARSTRGNGSGLGLAIVKWIVQQHGGKVEVESRLGEGTVFTVLLPIFDPKHTEAEYRTQPQLSSGARAKAIS